MRDRAVRRLAWSSVVVSALLSTLAAVIVARSGPPTGVYEIVGPTTVGTQIVIGLGLLVFPVVGALIASRRPEHPIGWLFCIAGIVLGLAIFTSSYAYHALDTNPGSLPGGAAVGVLGDALWVPDLAFTSVFLFLLFPDGRLSTRWEAITGRLAVFAVAVSFLGGLTEPTLYAAPKISNPLPIRASEAVTGFLLSVGFFLLLGCVASSVILLIKRFRRSRGEQREQTKWFVYSAALVFLFFVPSNIVDSPPALLQLAGGLSLISLPISVGIAILKYRLYEIDVVISKTVVFGVLAAFITFVYVGIVVGVGTAIGARGNAVLSGVAAAVVAVAFQPVRRWAGRVADRLVYGERATPYQVLAEFSGRIAETYATQDLLPRMARILAEAAGAARADVWLRIGPTLRDEAAWPTDAGPLPAVDAEPTPDGLVPVVHQGELLGALSVEKKPGDPLSPTDTKLVADLAGQAGLVLRNVRLIEELRASRQRLVTAQDERSRKLERDIHDGAQQHLVALSVKLRLAEQLAPRDGEGTAALLAELQTEAGEALQTLRDLARGIYPPLLAEQGLVAALEAQARKASVPVTVDAGGLGRYPQDVESAVYFCTLEALNNVAKYANASAARVILAQANGVLTFEVSDDGRGFDVQRAGSGTGLQGMADRLEAIGGRLEVRSTPGTGTTIVGAVPVRE